MSEASRIATHDQLQDLDIFLRTGGNAGGDNLPVRVKNMGRTILGIANAAMTILLRFEPNLIVP